MTLPTMHPGHVRFRVLTSGSWTDLVACEEERVQETKRACEIVSKVGRLKSFRIVGADGATIEEFMPDSLGHYGWRSPGSAHDRREDR